MTPALLPLTSLRFFAALGIVLFHAGGGWGLPSKSSMPFSIAVELFFILSGFVLAYNYRSVPSFAEAFRIVGYRIARIWPLHLLTLAAFVMLFEQANDLSRLWVTVPLMQSWFGNYQDALNGNPVAWTISVELGFYLLFPLLTVLSTRSIVILASLLTLATVAVAFQFRGVPFMADAPSAPAFMRLHPGSFMIQFVAGMILCRVYLARSWQQLSIGSATLLEVAAMGLALGYFFANGAVLDYLTSIWIGPKFLRFGVMHVLAIVAFAPLIFALAIGRGWVSQVLSNRALVFLGEISFATYMCHLFILLIVVRAGLSDGASLMAYFGSIYCASALLYLGVERPAQRILRRAVNISLGFRRSSSATVLN